MKLIIRLFRFAMVGISMFNMSCSTFFETDIESDIVVLLAPADSLRTSMFKHTFWWNHVDDADNYTLQIVSPGFYNIRKLVLDTSITDNHTQYTLYPDTFEWRVRANNSAYSTPFTTNYLIIDTSNGVLQTQKKKFGILNVDFLYLIF